MGVALSLGATLALEALRPAARAFGARLAKKVAPDAENEEEAARELEEKISSSANVQRSALEGVRRLLDSIAPEVARPLADLSAEYVNGNKPPDGFFRSAARLLGDLTAAEFSTLQELLSRSVHRPRHPGSNGGIVHVQGSQRRPRGAAPLPVRAPATGG
jgi:hypothetical protein